jgi:hypothetical protein
MKRALLFVAAAAFVALGMTGAAREAKTVIGEVVDVNCSLKKGDEGVGEAHKDCATACARRGQPLAILASDGLYILKGEWTKNNNEKLIEFIAAKVEAAGEVTEVNGKKMLVLSSVKLAK